MDQGVDDLRVGATASLDLGARGLAERQRGVCQDFAHLGLVLFRSIGIPARYVSGYFHPSAEGRSASPGRARVTHGSRRG